jgi:hypothetical protein
MRPAPLYGPGWAPATLGPSTYMGLMGGLLLTEVGAPPVVVEMSGDGF